MPDIQVPVREPRRVTSNMGMPPNEEKVYEAMKKNKITTAEAAKKVDEIAKLVAPMGKGQVASAVAQLKSKGLLGMGSGTRANSYFVAK